MQNIMRTCPSIRLHNLHYTTIKIFPQQDHVNEQHHLETSHPMLALLSLSYLFLDFPVLSVWYKPSLSPSPSFCLSSSIPSPFSISFPSRSTCASHRPLILSLLKAKRSQTSPFNPSYFNGKQLNIKKGHEEGKGGSVGIIIDG